MKTKSKMRFILAVLSGLLLTQACEKKPSVVTTDEGLVIEDLVTGEGDIAENNSAVSVHYTGWLLDEAAADKKGKQFDSSLTRNSEFSFVLNQGRVIKGWDKGVVGMRVGGKRRLKIPPALAYGERGAGADIPPNSTLIFDVELFGVDNVKIIDHKIGDGEEAVKGSKVAVHYTGWIYEKLANGNKGQQFDSSRTRDKLFSFVLGAKRVIPGWDIGVTGMKVGGSRTLIIPSSLAYGKQGAGSAIPPDAKLMFDIELFEVDAGAIK